MLEFETMLQKYGSQGEKTGWTYIEIPACMAQQLKPANKRSFRVKGTLDSTPFSGLALTPVGEGNFILPLKSEIRRMLRKGEGATVQVTMEVDAHYKVVIPDDLLSAFDDDEEALARFNELAASHRNYFIKWINEAKTPQTRVRRIVNTVSAMIKHLNYAQMLRAMKYDI